jgi:hypothetical protein
MTAVAMAAKTFSQRPSTLLGVRDPVLALALDLAGMERLVELRERASDELAGGSACPTVERWL